MTTTDMSHYDAILQRQMLHRAKLQEALAWKPGKRRDAQIAYSERQIASIEKERVAEAARCGISEIEAMSDDELLAALEAE